MLIELRKPLDRGGLLDRKDTDHDQERSRTEQLAAALEHVEAESSHRLVTSKDSVRLKNGITCS